MFESSGTVNWFHHAARWTLRQWARQTAISHSHCGGFGGWLCSCSVSCGDCGIPRSAVSLECREWPQIFLFFVLPDNGFLLRIALNTVVYVLTIGLPIKLWKWILALRITEFVKQEFISIIWYNFVLLMLLAFFPYRYSLTRCYYRDLRWSGTVFISVLSLYKLPVLFIVQVSHRVFHIPVNFWNERCS